MQIVVVNLERFVEFSISKQTVIYKNTCLPVANSFMHKHCRNGRIDASGKTAHYVAGRPDSFANFLDLFLNKLCRCPIAFALANFKKEISQYFLAKRRMRDF